MSQRQGIFNSIMAQYVFLSGPVCVVRCMYLFFRYMCVFVCMCVVVGKTSVGVVKMVDPILAALADVICHAAVGWRLSMVVCVCVFV